MTTFTSLIAIILYTATTTLSNSLKSISLSTLQAELTLEEERQMTSDGAEFLAEYSDNDIANNKTLDTFRRFLSQIPVGDRNIAPSARATNPVDLYAAAYRLVYDWPRYLAQIMKLQMDARSSNFENLKKRVVDRFRVNGNGTVHNPNVTEYDLKWMRTGIQRIRYTYEIPEFRDLTNQLEANQISDIERAGLEIPDDINFEEWTYHCALCNGSIISPLKSWQHCYYEWKFVPYLRLKVELIWLNPFVAIYYDLMTESQRSDIVDIVGSIMRASEIDENDGEGIARASVNLRKRTSMSRWLRPQFYPPVDKLYRDISFWSGLDTTVSARNTSAESLQVVNYGLGGMFNAHTDYFDDKNGSLRQILSPNLENSGQRMMTWMFYLSEPIFGGATVFPRLRQRVVPVRRSALVWENLRNDSSVEPLSLHAGCPVAIGQKWIANVWIRDNGQVLTRPCPRK